MDNKTKNCVVCFNTIIDGQCGHVHREKELIKASLCKYHMKFEATYNESCSNCFGIWSKWMGIEKNDCDKDKLFDMGFIFCDDGIMKFYINCDGEEELYIEYNIIDNIYNLVYHGGYSTFELPLHTKSTDDIKKLIDLNLFK